MVATSEEPAGDGFLSGMINRELLASQVEDLKDNIFLLCGPPPMIEAMKRILAELGGRRATVRWRRERMFEPVHPARADRSPGSAFSPVHRPASQVAAVPTVSYPARFGLRVPAFLRTGTTSRWPCSWGSSSWCTWASRGILDTHFP